MGQANNNDRFMNPYNFIAFPKQKAKAYDDTDRRTGVIKYSITTKTPLFVPNSSSDSAFQIECKDHKSYDFFSYTELEEGENYKDTYHEPVIPGSEIRGVVRSVYETLTDSCMGILNAEIHPVKRVPVAFKPALLQRENDEIIIVPAKSYRIGNSLDDDCLKRYNGGEKLYFKFNGSGNNKGNPIIKEYNESKENGEVKTGYLIKWGKGVKKKRYHIFEKSGNEITRRKNSEIKQIVEDVINSYLEQPALDSFNKEAYEAYRNAFRKFIKGEGEYFPINYAIVENKKLYLSPSTFGKEVSNNNIGKLAGNMLPCSKKEEMCPACDLFGFVSSDEKHSSGIRFSDLYIAESSKKNDNKDYYRDIITLPALAAPKLGNVDFYLKRPSNAKFWTYDYYVDSLGVHLADGELRGRKFYWHHQMGSVQKKPLLSAKQTPTNLNKTVRPVDEGITFSGELYFENISEKQLKQLCWILNMGKKNLGLKLGSAKPFGFGTVTTKVDSVTERIIRVEDDSLLYELKDHSKEVENLEYNGVYFSKAVEKEFYRIAGLESISKDQEITYPKTQDQKKEQLEFEGFRWFGLNHSNRICNDRSQLKINNSLDAPLDLEAPGLPYLADRKSNNAGYNGRNQRSNNRNNNGNNHYKRNY